MQSNVRQALSYHQGDFNNNLGAGAGARHNLRNFDSKNDVIELVAQTHPKHEQGDSRARPPGNHRLYRML